MINLRQKFQQIPYTMSLTASFIAVFLLQILNGVNVFSPTGVDLLAWGANVLPLTMGNEPWRLLSSAFLHIGLMHLLFNTWAMYVFGSVAEPMFGGKRFLSLFLLAAVGGSLLNNIVMWYDLQHGKMFHIAAGASGGIMGLGAALTVTAIAKIPFRGMVLNARTLIALMAVNLLYGLFVQGIDNAAHIGGALTGIIIGLSFVAEKSREQWAWWRLPCLRYYPNPAKQKRKPKIFSPTWIIMLLLAAVFISTYWTFHEKLVLLLR